MLSLHTLAATSCGDTPLWSHGPLATALHGCWWLLLGVWVMAQGSVPWGLCIAPSPSFVFDFFLPLGVDKTVARCWSILADP